MRDAWASAAAALCGIGLVGACSSTQGGHGASGALDAGLDGAVSSVIGDAGSDATVLDGGAESDASSCDPNVTWPLMLVAHIDPLTSIANLDVNHGGPGVVSLAYAESINCAATIAMVTEADDAGMPALMSATWGDGAEVVAQYYATASPLLYSLTVGGSYSGTLNFQSRAGGAYGDGHVYAIGAGLLVKDGDPMTIAWTSAPAAVVNEIFDGMMATYAPAYPAQSDCTVTGDCFALEDDSSFGGAGSSIVGVRPLKLYMAMPEDTSAPSGIYTFLTGYTQALAADAGAVAPLSVGDGGVYVPSGCTPVSSLEGSCASPVATATCTAGEVVYGCRDYPQSGYAATCCGADAGP